MTNKEIKKIALRLQQNLALEIPFIIKIKPKSFYKASAEAMEIMKRIDSRKQY